MTVHRDRVELLRIFICSKVLGHEVRIAVECTCISVMTQLHNSGRCCDEFGE